VTLQTNVGSAYGSEHPAAANERLKLLAGIPLIPIDRRVEAVAEQLVARSLIPKKALLNALHVASAAVAKPGGSSWFLHLEQSDHLNLPCKGVTADGEAKIE
jgi:hypothetical protein